MDNSSSATPRETPQPSPPSQAHPTRSPLPTEHPPSPSPPRRTSTPPLPHSSLAWDWEPRQTPQTFSQLHPLLPQQTARGSTPPTREPSPAQDTRDTSARRVPLPPT